MNADTNGQLFPMGRDRQQLVRLSKRRAVQRYRRLLRRCWAMTPHEVAYRVGALFGGTRCREDAPGFATDEAGRCRWSESVQQRLFFSATERTALIAQLVRLDPDYVARVRTAAAMLRDGGAAIFGRAVRLNPDTIDWCADPVCGRRLWPDEPLDEAGAVAWAAHAEGVPAPDVKYVWELNRHQFLPTLGCAFWLDDEPSYAELAAALVERWIVQNPEGQGVNWSSRLEVGLRAIAWLWTMPFLLGWPGLGSDRRDRWLASLGAHYDFLRCHLSLYADRTNHLIGEAAALWMLTTVLPDLPAAADERDRALDILRVEAERQITIDGVSREQAVGYHCFVLDFYLQVIALARRHGLTLPALIESRVAGMLEFLVQLLGAGGEVPQIGDDDNGRGIPSPRPPGTMRERAEALLAAGACVFDRPDWRAGAPAAADLPVWLLGSRARLTGAVPRRTPTSTVLRDGGYAFLEDLTGHGHALQLIFDVSGVGDLPDAAHAHADALSILIRVNRTLILADPGTGVYNGAPAIRNGFRGTASHNTIVIDNLDQADTLETFKWVNPATTSLIAWHSTPAFDYVAAEHDGYLRLRRPVRHCREVLFVKPEYWVVLDRIVGRGAHQVTRRFHFAPEVGVEQVDAVTFDALSLTSGDGLRFVFPDCAAATSTLRVEDVPWSAHYGKWESARCLTADTIGSSLPPLVTVIVPMVSGGAVVPVRRCTATDVPGGVLYHVVIGAVAQACEDVLAVPRTRPARGAGPGLIFTRRTAHDHTTRTFDAGAVGDN